MSAGARKDARAQLLAINEALRADQAVLRAEAAAREQRFRQRPLIYAGLVASRWTVDGLRALLARASALRARLRHG